MVAVELFLGMAIAGLAGVLFGVGLQAWRRTRMRKMAVTAAAFGAAALGGALYVALLVAEGAGSVTAPVLLAGGTLASLALFYFALFGRPE